MLAADVVGHPSEERAAETIEDAVERDRKGQRRHLESGEADRRIGDLEVVRDRRDLGRRHQAAGGDHHEHQIHHPEDRAAQHLRRRKVDLGLRQIELLLFCRHRHRRPANEEGEREHDQALPDAEIEERALIAAGRDHAGDRHHGDGGARAEAGRGRARGEAAAVRKPFQRVADAGAVDRAGADAGDDGGGVQHRQRVRVGIQNPGHRDHHAAEHDDDARAVFIDEPGFDRDQPGLGHDEDREGELDRGAAPVIFRIDRIDEQRPAILQVGDHRHADDAHDQLKPAGAATLGAAWVLTV